jgi:hypothetical protein
MTSEQLEGDISTDEKDYLNDPKMTTCFEEYVTIILSITYKTCHNLHFCDSPTVY